MSFPGGFHITQNRNYWSNEEEAFKFVKHIINPRAIATRKELQLSEDQISLLNWDVFKGQCTGNVKTFLEKLNIKVVTVPANMTHFFQPLDLTVNGSAKHFMKKKFVTWYDGEVKKEIEEGRANTGT